MRSESAIVFALLSVTSAQAAYVSIASDDLPTPVKSRVQNINKLLFSSVIQRPLSATLTTPILEQDSRKVEALQLIGSGYDIWTKHPTFSTCVDYDAKDVTLIPYRENSPNPKNVFVFDDINSIQQHYKNHSEGESVDLVFKAFSLGGSNDRYSGSHYQSTSQYIDTHVVYLGDQYTLFNRGKPSQVAISQYGNGSDLTNFAKRCGQAFISSVAFGVELNGEMAFTVDINDSTSNNQQSLSVGIKKIISLSATSSDGFTQASQVSTISSNIEGAAAGSQPKPVDFAEFVRTFGSSVSAGSSPYHVLIEVTSYGEMPQPMFKNFDDVSSIALGSVSSLVGNRLIAIQTLSDLQSAASHATFYKSSPADIKKSVDSFTFYLDSIGGAYKTCRTALKPTEIGSCKAAVKNLPAIPDRPDLSLNNQKPPPP